MAMTPLGMAGIMAALGLAKSAFVDAPAAERQRQLAAETMRYSPYTGMTPNAVKEADPFGSAFQFGFTGAALGQGAEQNQAYQEYLDKLNEQEATKTALSTSAFKPGNYSLGLPNSTPIAQQPSQYNLGLSTMAPTTAAAPSADYRALLASIFKL
jgi:hypothetical protein